MTAADGAPPLPQDARSPSGDGVAPPPAPAVGLAPSEPVTSTVEPAPPRKRAKRVFTRIGPDGQSPAGRLWSAASRYGELRASRAARGADVDRAVFRDELTAALQHPVLRDAARAVIAALRELETADARRRRTRRARR